MLLSQSTVSAEAHQSTIETIRQVADLEGRTVLATNRYIELATGLNQWDAGRKQWVPAVAEFERTDDGYFVARQTQTRLILPPDLSTEPVDMLGPDGVRLISAPIGVAVVDLSTGDTALLGDLRTCRAEQVTSHTVVYRDCFGGLKADLVYEINLAGMEQFVVLREWIPALADLGMDPAHARVHVYTEFFSPPEPRAEAQVLKHADEATVAQRVWEPDLIDRELLFGERTRMIPGRAFAAGEQNVNAPVAKRFEAVGDRRLLVESCDYANVAPWLENLPVSEESGNYEGARLEPGKLVPSNLPSRQASQPRWAALPFDNRLEEKAWASVTPGSLKAMDTATYLAASGPGLVLDYTTIGANKTDYTFQGDQTYYVTNTVYFYGTTTLESGAVLKFAKKDPGPSLWIRGPLDCRTTPYRPAIFTARDDDTVGATLTDSTGSVTNNIEYAGCPLYFYYMPCDITVQHAQFRYAEAAIGVNGGTNSYTARHLQMVGCATGVHVSGNATLTAENILMHDTTFRAAACPYDTNYSPVIRGSHWTVDGANNFAQMNSGGHLYLTNSLITTITNWGYGYTLANCATPTNSGIYTSAGAGSHYLAPDSPFRSAATEPVSAELEADLKTMTTWPPLNLTNLISVDTVLVPQAAKDTDLQGLGYHYAPLDYLASNVVVTAELTLSDGVALGLAGSFGLRLGDNSGLASLGQAGEGMNHIVSQANVQEDAVDSGGLSFLEISSATARPTVSFRFTDFSLSQGQQATLSVIYSSYLPGTLSLRDCTVQAALLSLWPDSPYAVGFSLNNNLFERCYVQLHRDYDVGQTPFSVAIYNNLFRAGALTLDYDCGSQNPTWHVNDNLFDGASQSLTGDGTAYYVSTGYNGFIDGTSNSLGGSNNHTGLNPDYVAGPLGRYYYSTDISSDLTDLVEAGSRSAAAAGLYHYTVLDDLTPAGSSNGSIGFHYVATDANGVPLDTDREGLPDYVEDADGDGVVDNSETSYQVADTDEDGLSDYSELAVFSSDPLYAYSLNYALNGNTNKMDAQFLFTARATTAPNQQSDSLATLSAVNPDAPLWFGRLQFTVGPTDAQDTRPLSRYDLYYVPTLWEENWQWRRVYCDIDCIPDRTVTWLMDVPDPTQGEGYFAILDAADSDEDGLSDGYEAWFYYDGDSEKRTFMDSKHSDADALPDGWEVEYGLDPLDATDDDGNGGNPDSDNDSNLVEYTYYNVLTGAHDPLKASPADRPIVSISEYTLRPDCKPSFTVTRSGDDSSALAVYFSVGGTMSYADGDYTMEVDGSPLPLEDYPRIFSVEIPAGSDHVTVTLTTSMASPEPGELLSLAVAITPYAVAPETQVATPGSWAYVLDWSHSRATLHPLPCPPTGALITGNSASRSYPPILTYNYDTGELEESFVPEGAILGASGRGLAIYEDEIYYTELDTGWMPYYDTAAIHIAPYGTKGSGGDDAGTPLSNPRDATGIQALAFHYDAPNTYLYALTGYLDHPLKVYKLNPSTGVPIGDPVEVVTPVRDPATWQRGSSDGFAVLPNGNFLINDYDGERAGAVYREYDGESGERVVDGLEIDPGALGFQQCTGVAVSPDGESLYFLWDFDTIVHTGIDGTLLGTRYIGHVEMEDIDVVLPQQ